MSRFNLTRTGFDRLPGLHPLFLDYIGPRTAPFYPEGSSIDDIERFARSRRGGGVAGVADVLAAQAARWGASSEPARALGRGAVAVVTGQQAGLMTGPLLAIFKALTAVKLARELGRRGVAAVPVFWIAADDHDLAEISATGFVNAGNRFQRVEAAFTANGGAPAGWARYSESVGPAVAECFASLPSSPHIDEVRAILEGACHPGASPVDAFARVMLSLFRGTDLVMADPMDPALRVFAAGVLGDTLHRNGELRAAVLERTQAIRRAGYREQVKVDETFTGLFRFRDGRREAFDPAEANGVSPSDLSPNVLLRPVVQDTLFPTAAFVAGPAEIAYLAQAGAAYECLGRAMPPICPRISATLIDPPAARILARYGLTFADVLEGPAHLRERLVFASGDGAHFDAARERVLGEIGGLRPLVESADPTLGGALDNTIRKVSGQIDALRARFEAARTRKDRLLEDHLNSLTDRLLPDGKLQERVLNVTSFLVRYGPALVSILDEALDPDGGFHQVVEL